MLTSRWQQRADAAKILRKTIATLELDSLSCIYFPLPMGFEYKPRWKTHLWIPGKRRHSEAGKTNCVIKGAKKKKR
jgi:hypothetical protein